ncbi:MAG: hypothetical protein KBC27_00415 [Rickettsiales bacterium]|nr:hypothetical protein [Rickettsiales bacterium]
MTFLLYNIAINQNLVSLDKRHKINSATKFADRELVLKSNEEYKISFCKFIFSVQNHQVLLNKELLESALVFMQGSEQSVASELGISMADIDNVKKGQDILIYFNWSFGSLLKVVGEIKNYDKVFAAACKTEYALESVLANEVFLSKISKKGLTDGLLQAVEANILGLILPRLDSFEKIDAESLFSPSSLMDLTRHPEAVEKIKNILGFSRFLHDYLSSCAVEDKKDFYQTAPVGFAAAALLSESFISFVQALPYIKNQDLKQSYHNSFSDFQVVVNLELLKGVEDKILFGSFSDQEKIDRLVEYKPKAFLYQLDNQVYFGDLVQGFCNQNTFLMVSRLPSNSVLGLLEKGVISKVIPKPVVFVKVLERIAETDDSKKARQWFVDIFRANLESVRAVSDNKVISNYNAALKKLVKLCGSVLSDEDVSLLTEGVIKIYTATENFIQEARKGLLNSNHQMKPGSAYSQYASHVNTKSQPVEANKKQKSFGLSGTATGAVVGGVGWGWNVYSIRAYFAGAAGNAHRHKLNQAAHSKGVMLFVVSTVLGFAYDLFQYFGKPMIVGANAEVIPNTQVEEYKIVCDLRPNINPIKPEDVSVNIQNPKVALSADEIVSQNQEPKADTKDNCNNIIREHSEGGYPLTPDVVINYNDHGGDQPLLGQAEQ